MLSANLEAHTASVAPLVAGITLALQIRLQGVTVVEMELTHRADCALNVWVCCAVVEDQVVHVGNVHQ